MLGDKAVSAERSPALVLQPVHTDEQLRYQALCGSPNEASRACSK